MPPKTPTPIPAATGTHAGADNVAQAAPTKTPPINTVKSTPAANPNSPISSP